MSGTNMDECFMLKKGQFFAKLFGMPSIGSLEILYRDAEDLGIRCRLPLHRIIVVEIELWEELFSRKDRKFDPEIRSEVMFVLSNLGYDLFSVNHQYQVESADYQGRLIFWIDAETDSTATEVFRLRAEQIVQLLESEYGMFVTFSISPWFSDLLQAFQVYQDTLNTLYYYRYLSDPHSVYAVEDMPKYAGSAALSDVLAAEEELLSDIRSGSFGRVREHLQVSFRRRFQDSAVPLPLFPQRRAAFNELLEMTVTELEKCSFVPAPLSEQIIFEISSAETAAEQLDRMDLLLDDLLEPAAGHRQPPEWIGRLTQYIDAHYDDPNLTVYFLADQVGLTPSYCTRIFRKYMGMNILEYLQRQRVHAAVRILESGCNMSDAAQRAGFSCTQTLRRTLKQYRAKL